jgi:hypothetical protein
MVTEEKRVPPRPAARIRVADLTPYSSKAPTMHWEMIRIEKEGFQPWACSAYAWEYNPLGLPHGRTIAEMNQNYERQRDSEFRSHLSSEHPRVPKSYSRLIGT